MRSCQWRLGAQATRSRNALCPLPVGRGTVRKAARCRPTMSRSDSRASSRLRCPSTIRSARTANTAGMGPMPDGGDHGKTLPLRSCVAHSKSDSRRHRTRSQSATPRSADTASPGGVQHGGFTPCLMQRFDVSERFAGEGDVAVDVRRDQAVFTYVYRARRSAPPSHTSTFSDD